MTGPAGTLFILRTDVLHRGSAMTGERSGRFALIDNYDLWGPRWTGRVAWAERTTEPEWVEIVERATPQERSVFGWPAPRRPVLRRADLGRHPDALPRGGPDALQLREPARFVSMPQ